MHQAFAMKRLTWREQREHPINRTARGNFLTFEPEGRHVYEGEIPTFETLPSPMINHAFPRVPKGPHEPVVYFVQRGLDSAVKIGFTRDLRQRMHSLRATQPAPVVLLGTVPGGEALEQSFHSEFSQARIEGEWFAWHPRLARFIAITTHNPPTSGSGL